MVRNLAREGAASETDNGMRISIAMAVFNGERFLREQLGSLASQDLLPHELVVTDDCSTDRTLRILEEFAATAPFPVRLYVNDKQLGYADNFLKAACHCNGDLIAFCDQDDVWRTDKLAYCLNQFEFPDVQLIAHSTAEVDTDLKFIGRSPRIRRSFTIRRQCESPSLPWSVGCAAVIRREVVQEMARRWPADHAMEARRFGRHILGHDQVAFFVANALGDIRFVAEPLIQHRVHGANATNSLPTLARTLSFASGVGRDAYREQTRSLRMNARFLAKMAVQDGIPAVSSVLRDKAAGFMKAAACAKMRALIYGEKNRLRRLRLILAAARRGFYRPQFGLHGARSIAKDLVTVPLGHVPRFRWHGR
jgi:glycosyltransferase involved in cell wall biosynthesis